MKKRILASSLLFIIALSFFGCNTDELNYFDTIKSIASLEEFVLDGEIQLDVTKFEVTDVDPSTVTEYMNSDIVYDISNELITKKVSGLIYKAIVSEQNNKLMMAVGIRYEKGRVSLLFNMIVEDKTVYIPLVKVEKIFGTGTYNTKIIDDILYAMFTFEEIADIVVQAQCDALLAHPSEYPDYDNDYVGENYDVDSYVCGIDAGLADGFDGKPSNPTNVDPYTTDPTSYSAGYDVGFQSGTDQRSAALEQIDSINAKKDKFVEKATVKSLIKGFRSIWAKSSTEIVKNFFDELSFDAVKKNGNKYTATLNNDNIYDIAKKLISYIIDNVEDSIPVLKSILTQLSDDELVLLLIDPAERQSIIDSLDAQVMPDTDQKNAAKEVYTDLIDSFKALIADSLKLNLVTGLEKVDSSSFVFNDSLTAEYSTPVPVVSEYDDNMLPVSFNNVELDFTLKNKLKIYKLVPDEVVLTAQLNNTTSSGAAFNVSSTDINVIEVGIAYSTSSDLSNPVFVPGVASSSGFAVNLTGINPNTTYYYKAYTKDMASNILYSSQLSNFTTTQTETDTTTTADTTANTTPSETTAPPASTTNEESPKTGSSTGYMFVAVLTSAIVIFYTFSKRSKYNSAK